MRRRQAATLKIVLGVIAVMFVLEFCAGYFSGSVSLVADSLDMLGDAMVYGFSLYAVAESQRTKALSAFFKGIIMLAFGLFVLGQVVYKLAVPQVPDFAAIGVVGLLALAANGFCFAQLWQHRSDDINMSSVWLCSRNDIIANIAVIAAAGGVWLTSATWPDLVVGVAIAALFLKSAFSVVSGSARELRRLQA
ncbi:MAG: cation transporter [Xanthomonadales bacterium]|nr:cation transporter [Xanthomonadales bacterium]